jgi:hypothetical protein
VISHEVSKLRPVVQQVHGTAQELNDRPRLSTGLARRDGNVIAAGSTALSQETTLRAGARPSVTNNLSPDKAESP